MKRIFLAATILILFGTVGAIAQKDSDEPTSWLKFVVIKDDTGKPVRNAAVIMHPVNPKGKQGHGGMELKTGPDGKADFDGIPYGKLRVQVLARGFQTYGEDFDVDKPKVELTIKLKRPQGQFSVYEDHPQESDAAPPKQEAPPSEQKDKAPN